VRIDEMLEAHHGRPEQEWLALGPAAAEILQVIAAGEEEHPFRKRAIQVLGKLKDKGALVYLSRILSDNSEDRILRMVAARAVGEIGGPAAASMLSEAAVDRDELVRHKVVQALGAAAETRSVVRLREIAETDTSELVKAAASDAIRRISLRHNLNLD
jgi:HEAT repeat protein